jgi:hypothetical protein
MKTIPKYVQTFNRISPSDQEKKVLINIFNDGGMAEIDKEMKRRNPKAPLKIPYVASKSPILINKNKAKFDRKKQNIGNWIYCGNRWYVRSVDGDFGFAKFMAYNTDKRIVEDEWDEEKYVKA